MLGLLEPACCDVATAYHAQVVAALGAPVEVRDAGPGRGKGVFATRDLAAGDLIFRERALVSQQDSASQEQVTACAQCHRFVGSVEQRIAQLLRHVQRRAQPPHARQPAGACSSGHATSAVAQSHSQGGGTNQVTGDEDNQEDEEERLEWQQRLHLLDAYVTPELLDDLENGRLRFPQSDQIPMPTPVHCAYGCGETYCSTACAESAWQQQHCLLCPGSRTAAAHANSSGSGSSSSATAVAQQPPDVVHGMAVDRAAMWAFLDHSSQTNDVFRLAAKLVASVAVRASLNQQSHSSQAPCEKLAGATSNRSDQVQVAAASASSEQQALGTDTGVAASSSPLALSTSGSASKAQTASAGLTSEAALAAAWLPYAVGWKRLWWEAVAVPEDVASEGGEEEFTEQLRELASDSLVLLCKALPGVVSAWPALLQLPVWGSVVGMFELNNLGLTVPSPVEDFFLLIDELPEPQRLAAQSHTQRWLDALDRWYDTPLQGTGFFALQSCANHSCAPNAGTEGEADGRVAVYALKAIPGGTEVTISYLDEAEGDNAWTYQQRQAALRDYGFTCACERCEAERASRSRKPTRKGIKLGRR